MALNRVKIGGDLLRGALIQVVVHLDEGLWHLELEINWLIFQFLCIIIEFWWKIIEF